MGLNKVYIRGSSHITMKILMIAPTPFFSDRGCHIRVLNSYLDLKSKGHKITLITYPTGRNLLKINPIRVSKIPGYSKTSPGFSFYKPFLDLLMFSKAKKEMKSKDYDLIYAHLHEGALIGYFLKKKFNKKLIFDSQGSLVGELEAGGQLKKNSIFSKFIGKIERFITKQPDEIITSTEGLRNFILNDLKIKKSIKVVKDFPNKSIFNSKVKPAKLSLPKNKKIIVYLGGLQKYKGIDHLLEAIPQINQKAHFLIMGYPLDYVSSKVKELNIADRVTLTGKISYEKAPMYLKLGDIAVSPKTLESGEANAKIYNYLAMDLPVVCFDMPETREIKKEFPKSKIFFAKHKDVKDLAKKVDEALR
jgi:glycosyltransferase involved in cell wall biosynthesis